MFLGRVIEIEALAPSAGAEVQVLFDVLAAWKGPRRLIHVAEGDAVSARVQQARPGGGCSVPYELGLVYLVYARPAPRSMLGIGELLSLGAGPGVPRSSLCSRTMVFGERALRDMQTLGAPLWTRIADPCVLGREQTARFVRRVEATRGYARAYTIRHMAGLGGFAAPAVPELTRALDTSEHDELSIAERDVRTEILRTLGVLGADAGEAVPVLRALLLDGAAPAHLAASALGEIGGTAGVDALLEGLASEHDETVASSVRALGGLGGDAQLALPALEAARRVGREHLDATFGAAIDRIRSGAPPRHAAVYPFPQPPGANGPPLDALCPAGVTDPAAARSRR